MAEFPALPLWTDAYLGDTTHLTTIEHGAYLLLLISMWRAGGTLLDDDRLLAKYVHMTPAQWVRISANIRPFFKATEGRISQGRLSDELKAVKQNSKRQSDRVKARWLKTKDTGDTAAIPDAYRNDTTLPLPLTIKKDSSSSSTQAREIEPVSQASTGTDADKLLFDVMKAVGLTNGLIPTYWMPPAATVHVWRWHTDLGLSADHIVDAARESRKTHGTAPSGPKALDGQMQRLAAAINSEALKPSSATNQQEGTPNADQRRHAASTSSRYSADRLNRIIRLAVGDGPGRVGD